MEESFAIEKILSLFFKFLLGIWNGVFGVLFTLFLMYLSFVLVSKYAVCGGNKEEYSKFVGYIRSGVKDLAVAFKNATPAIVESAKLWAENKLDDIAEARRSKQRSK